MNKTIKFSCYKNSHFVCIAHMDQSSGSQLTVCVTTRAWKKWRGRTCAVWSWCCSVKGAFKNPPLSHSLIAMSSTLVSKSQHICNQLWYLWHNFYWSRLALNDLCSRWWRCGTELPRSSWVLPATPPRSMSGARAPSLLSLLPRSHCFMETRKLTSSSGSSGRCHAPYWVLS